MTAEAAEKAKEGTGEAHVEPQLDSPVTPTPDDDERLRGLIRAELDRQHAMPLARRTLELLTEAEIEPSRDEPGYRVIGRDGETRLLRDRDADPDEGGDLTSPMTLRDLVAELRERHPDLFATPPAPVVVDPIPPPPPPELEHDALADVKAAGARFVETQSALAKSFATHSAERSRTLAHAASGRFEGWRKALGDRFKAKPTPVLVASVAPPPAAEPRRANDVPVPNLPVPVPGTHSDDRPGRGLRVSLPRIDWHAFDTHRIAFIGLAAATVLVVVLVAMMALRRDSGTSPPQNETQRVEAGQSEPKQAAKNAPKEATNPETKNPSAPPAQEPRPAPPSTAPEDAEAAPIEEQPRNPNDLAGVPDVIDTATLKLSGKVIHLFGVEWVRGGQAEELTKYIRGRSVTCRPASGSSAFLCSLEGRDLSEVVLFNGGGRASSEASPDLVAAEDHARSERLGVWKR